ncbi:MAG: SRPBCC family protein [Chloroflexi bacterium]|nr:SRPBCC family protein [Chloroflexota bacterium]
MAIDVRAEVQIARTREDVAAYVVNPENDALWIGGIESARMLTEPPVGVGTRVARVASFMGKRIEYTPEVVAYEANSLLTMRTDRPFDMLISNEFEDSDGGTLARIRIQGVGSRFFRLAAPLLGPAVKRNIKSDLRNLKAILEAVPDDG